MRFVFMVEVDLELEEGGEEESRKELSRWIREKLDEAISIDPLTFGDYEASCTVEDRTPASELE